MSEDWEGFTYKYDPTPHTFDSTDAGAEPMWMYCHSGKAGPAIAIPGVMLHDGEGGATWVQNGEPREVTVVDDRADNAENPAQPEG